LCKKLNYRDEEFIWILDWNLLPAIPAMMHRARHLCICAKNLIVRVRCLLDSLRYMNSFQPFQPCCIGHNICAKNSIVRVRCQLGVRTENSFQPFQPYCV
jgi:hypothetical protein